MIRTRPVPISFLTKERFNGPGFVLGRRVSGLLQEPFDRDALQKRVLRKDRDGKNAEMAYYIDTRALSLRLDQVLGANNWGTNIFEVKDAGDRLCVVATLTIGGSSRDAEGEELKQKRGWQSPADKAAGKEAPLVSEDLVFMKAGPQARKRAAVEFGVGAYLYGFSDVNTWEPLNDKGFPKDSNIDMLKLPEWARPTPGPTLVTREAAYLLNIQLPKDMSQTSKEDIETIKNFLAMNFGVETLSAGFSREDYIELASVIARISDCLDANGGTFEDLIAPLLTTKN